MTEITSIIPQLLTVLGVLAALTSLITQLTKKLGFLARIPTDAQVIVTAQLLAGAAAGAWAEHTATACTWQLVTGAVIGGLLVAFIAMYGWTTFFDLLHRFDPGAAGKDNQEK